MPNERFNTYQEAALFIDAFESNDDIDFFLEIASRYGGPILDLACGTGRVALNLAKEGYEVVGVDVAEAMLDVAKSKQNLLPSSAASKVSFVNGDITTLELGRKFPLVIIPTSFKFCLTSDQQIACLSSVNKHLEDDGVFVLDHSPAATRPSKGEMSEGPISVDGITYRRWGSFYTDYLNQIQKFEMTVEMTYPDGRIEKIQTGSEQALIYDREADLLLKISGFKVLEEYDDWTFNPYEPGMKRRIFLLKD